MAYTHDVAYTHRFLTDQDYKLDIANNMKEHGGSFVQALGECILRADSENLMKILVVFSDYVEDYQPDNWRD